jgi:hypothetical protein
MAIITKKATIVQKFGKYRARIKTRLNRNIKKKYYFQVLRIKHQTSVK